MFGTSSTVAMPLRPAAFGVDSVEMPTAVCRRLLRQAQDFHAAGLKAFGLLLGDPQAPSHPFQAVDFILFDPHRNRRNDPPYRSAFHAQGSYFREFDDAGFVADPTELLSVWRRIEELRLDAVAPFHVHRRQPANFSTIDYRLHNPAFAWHLIISLRDPAQPIIQPFSITKEFTDFGISDRDGLEGSERAYPGPEVSPLHLALTDALPTRSESRVQDPKR
jgi:proteasome lid subunit RPN8/RPN11